MAVTVEEFERLFRKLEDVIGYENTVTLMALVSPDGPDVAANPDLETIDLRERPVAKPPRRRANAS